MDEVDPDTRETRKYTTVLQTGQAFVPQKKQKETIPFNRRRAGVDGSARDIVAQKF
jgi:hypothetical protein